MASIGKIAELVGKGAGKAKLAAGKAASTAKQVSGFAKNNMTLKKQDIAASVRGAMKSKPKPMVGMTGDKTGKGLKVAAGATGAAAVASTVSKMGGSGDRQAKETGTPNVEKKVASSSKPTSKPTTSTSKPAAKGKMGPTRPATGQGKGKSTVYRAKAGDGLWQVAEKTVPKGQSVSAWWTQLKKLNSTNGKVNKTYRNSAIKLPPGAQPKDKGFEFPTKNTTSSKTTRNVE
jgi:hypothetical protein